MAIDFPGVFEHHLPCAYKHTVSQKSPTPFPENMVAGVSEEAKFLWPPQKKCPRKFILLGTCMKGSGKVHVRSRDHP